MQPESDREGDGECSLASFACSWGRKCSKSHDQELPDAKGKRRKVETVTDFDGALPGFDPSALVEAKEGTFRVPTLNLDRHMKQCLSKEEHDVSDVVSGSKSRQVHG